MVRGWCNENCSVRKRGRLSLGWSIQEDFLKKVVFKMGFDG